MDRYSGGKTKAVIRRDKIAQDGFDRLQDANLKQPLEIVFIDQFGQEEYVSPQPLIASGPMILFLGLVSTVEECSRNS